MDAPYSPVKINYNTRMGKNIKKHVIHGTRKLKPQDCSK